MKPSRSLRIPLMGFLFLFLLTCVASTVAHLIDQDFGRIEVARIVIPLADGDVHAKIYRPLAATEANPFPAVLAIHGYQNDKETSAGYALELARNGMVVLAIDAYGHGSTTFGLRDRGYDTSLGGPNRFKLFMSFSQLNGDSPGIRDSSVGGTAAYQYLKALPFVDAAQIGLTGHSMGTWAVWTIAAENPEIAASVVQCGEVYGPVVDGNGQVPYRNVLLIQAKYDEFDYFRDDALTVEGLNQTEKRYNTFMGQQAPVGWNTTVGSFADGTARRMALVHNIHRGITHDATGVLEATTWFRQAFDNPMAPAAIPSPRFLWRELLMLVAMLSAVLSTLPLASLLLRIPFFSSAAQPMPAGVPMAPKKWWKAAFSVICVSALTYPFLTQLGHGLFPFPESVFRALLANGVSVWFMGLILISALLFRRWFRKGEGKDLSWYDLGAAHHPENAGLDWRILGKTALLALLLFGYVYVFCLASTQILGTEFRFVWPFMKPFTAQRFGQFFLYLPFYLAFFLFNGGVRLFGQFRLPQSGSPARTQLVWWFKTSMLMLGGLVLVAAFEYIPFYLGIGPGFDAIGLSIFGGPFMTALIVIVPQFFVLFFAMSWFFRKTGTIYLGSLLTALLATWIATGASAIF